MKIESQKYSEILSHIASAETDGGTYFSRKVENYNTRFCFWPGQSDDGRKRRQYLGKEPFPWDGASDSRIRLADMLINENVILLQSAFFRAKVQCLPVEAGDASYRATVDTVMRWMLFTHCLDNLRREVELALQIREQYGLAILGVFWRQTTRVEKQVLSIDKLDQLYLETGDPQYRVLLETILNPDEEESATELLESAIPGMGKKSVVRALRETGSYEYDVPYIFENVPEWIAYEPWEDIIFPASCYDLQRARFIARRELLTPTELRERELTEGYSREFVELALKQKGVVRTTTRGSFRNNQILLEDDRELIEIWHFYEKVSRDQAIQIEITTLHRSVPDVVAKKEDLPYSHAMFPFVELPRERATRNLLESRGIPELVLTHQAEIKAQRDYRSDRASIAILPPLRVPANRGKLELILGPKSQIPERRPGEFGWMEPPSFDQGTIEIERATRADIDEYFGRMTAAVNPSLSMRHQQKLVDCFFTDIKLALQQTLQLMQQYMTDEEVMRIAGAMDRPFQATRQEIQGRYDLQVEFDVRDLDNEFLGQKLDYIARAIVPLDVAGVIDRANLVKFIMSALDPVMAQQLVKDPQAATAQEAEDEQIQFAKIAAGTEPPMKEGQNAALRLQVLQGIVQSNPAVKVRYQQDEIFRKMIDARMQHFEFMLQQQENAQIGRMGAIPALAQLQKEAA